MTDTDPTFDPEERPAPSAVHGDAETDLARQPAHARTGEHGGTGAGMPPGAGTREGAGPESFAPAPTSEAGMGAMPTPTAPTAAPSGTGRAPLVGGADQFAARWQSVQVTFVDEPRRAVEDADRLVREVMDRMTELFSSQRADLEQAWHSGGEASTEDLRVALQRYRSFFERLLAA